MRSRALVLASGIAAVSAGLLGASMNSHSYAPSPIEPARQAADAARLVAGKIDGHFAMLELALRDVGRRIKALPADVESNDAILRQAKSRLPDSIANMFVLARDGTNIGNALGNHPAAGDRDYFQKVIAGAPVAVGVPIRSRSNVGWVVPFAQSIKDEGGQLCAVIAAATYVSALRDLVGNEDVPFGSSVQMVDEQGSEVAGIAGDIADMQQPGALGLARMQLAPWLVRVVLPSDLTLVMAALAF